MTTNTQHTKHIPAKTYIGVFVALAIVTAIEVGITSVISRADPEAKLAELSRLAAAGRKVLFVGDGDVGLR